MGFLRPRVWHAIVITLSVYGVSAGQSVPPESLEPHCEATAFAEVVRKDAARYGVADIGSQVLGMPIPGGVEFQGERILDPMEPGKEDAPRRKRGKKSKLQDGGEVERADILLTPHLQIRASKEQVAAVGETASTHLVLTITNRTTTPIAYRVQTDVPDQPTCTGKVELAHNAIALPAKGSTKRTECRYVDRMKLKIKNVEVYEVTELGQRYLSKLKPGPGAFDMRVAAGHDGGEPTSCLPIREGELGAGGFQAMVDYYARHDCGTFVMPKTYEAHAEPRVLPVCDRPPPQAIVAAARIEAPKEPESGLIKWLAVFGALVVGVVVAGKLRPKKVEQKRTSGPLVVLEMKQADGEGGGFMDDRH